MGKLTASITNLDTGLANVNRDDFSHFSFRRAKATQNKKLALSGTRVTGTWQ
jgi:hypothetical protein